VNGFDQNWAGEFVGAGGVILALVGTEVESGFDFTGIVWRDAFFDLTCAATCGIEIIVMGLSPCVVVAVLCLTGNLHDFRRGLLVRSLPWSGLDKILGARIHIHRYFGASHY